jgi:RNA polymerase sigma factor (sigma-70 family)
MTERELLERFVTDRDQGALRILIDRHGPMVLSVCRSILDASADVEDAFQNTFLALVQGAATIQNPDSIGPWLHRVALRMARGAQAKAAERRVRERRVSKSEADYDEIDGDVFLGPLLQDELNQLPDRYRLPLVL